MNKSFTHILYSTLVAFYFSISVVFAQQRASGTNADVENRIAELLSKMTIEEKISLLGYKAPGIPRLQIQPYNWWNEALHGVARAGEATVFPQAIALAATFNDSLQFAIADVISIEARAKYNLATKMNRRTQYMGLTFWSPNINIFRDPRWGRGQETYGEDPYLTSRMGVAFVRGLQGSDPEQLKTAACAKHLVAHSGPEAGRHTFNAIVDEKDLRETYLYAFRALADMHVEAIMCGYNRVNGEPCCTGQTLLRSIVKNEWKFDGHLVTDCGALDDIWLRHKVSESPVVVAAEALKAGINLDCSNLLQDNLLQAHSQNLISTQDLDAALAPILRTQFKLGFFDSPASSPYAFLGEQHVRAEEHVKLARQAAQQSIVLLKNDKGILPLSKDRYSSILVAGANAASMDAMIGNYHGISSNIVTYVEGISQQAGPAVGVQYDLGCNDTDTVHFGGLWHSENTDLTIAVLGLTPVLEGEEGDAFLAANGGDRVDLKIPKSHVAFLKALRARHNKPIVAVITGGSSIDMTDIAPYADAVVLTWYSGEQGGNALGDLLFGKVSPSGRLPVTFYKSLGDLPDYKSYSMQGRTYRYFSGEVQYPFGFGLSYTSFDYKWNQSPRKRYASGDTLAVVVNVSNTGAYDGDEVVQAYIQYPDMERMPVSELKQFKRVHVKRGDGQNVVLRIPVAELRKWDVKKKSWQLYKGTYSIFIGSHSRDERLKASFTL